MKNLTLLSVCAFALSIGAAHAQNNLVDTADTPILGVTDPVDGNKSTAAERDPDMTMRRNTDTTVTIDEETNANEAGNYGEADTAPDEVDEDLAEGDGVIYEMDDENIETGTITNDGATEVIDVEDPILRNQDDVRQ